MSTGVGIGFMLIGVILCVGARSFAQSFQAPDTEAPLRPILTFAGLGRGDWSRVYRWLVAVVTGLFFFVVGLIGLVW